MKKLMALGAVALPLLTIAPAEARLASPLHGVAVAQAPIVYVHRRGHARHYHSPVREFAHWRRALVRSSYSQFGNPVLRNGYYVVRARHVSGSFYWLRVNANTGKFVRFHQRPY